MKSKGSKDEVSSDPQVLSEGQVEQLLKEKILSHVYENVWQFVSPATGGVTADNLKTIRPEIEKFWITSGQDLNILDKKFDRAVSDIVMEIGYCIMV